jgi:rhodanese-related sulfurtransferase
MLDPGKRYVVCCDTGRRSSAAAFILKQKDFQVVVLIGGLNQGEL